MKNKHEIESIFGSLREAVMKPERELSLGLAAVGLNYLMMEFPDVFPSDLKPVVEFFQDFPDWYFKANMLVAGVFAAHGTVRLVNESFPYWKAWVNVFVLGRIDTNDNE